MFSRKSPTHNRLHSATTVWKEAALEALETPEIRTAIGHEKSGRMHKLCKNAGSIIMAEGKIHKTYARNGLYIIPLHEDIPESTTLDLKQGFKRQTTIPVGKMAQEGNVCHVSDSSLKNVHFIGLSVESPYVSTQAERAAVTVHELTHADQYKRGIREDDLGSSTSLTLAESEAYTDQYHVMNYYWDGALDKIVESNIQNQNICEINVDNETLIARLNSSNVVKNALGAVIRNTAHAFTPNGYTLPSPELIQDYEQLNLLY